MLRTGFVTSAKKSLPLSSTTMNAGKSSTWIFQTASMPSSGYSSTSTCLMQSWASRAADRAEVEAAVLLAGAGDLGRAVALGEHHLGAAGGLELLHVGVHPA